MISSLLTFLKIQFIFQNSFRLTAKSSEKCRDFPCTPCPDTWITSLIINISHHSDTVAIIYGVTLTLLSPNVHSLQVLKVVHSTCLDKYIMTCTHHDSTRQNSFTALRILCVLLIHLTLLLNPQQPLLFTVAIVCLSQNALELESYNRQPVQMGFFHLVICI